MQDAYILVASRKHINWKGVKYYSSRYISTNSAHIKREESFLRLLKKVVKDSRKANRQHNANNVNNQLVGTSPNLIESFLHAAVHVGDSVIDAVHLGAVLECVRLRAQVRFKAGLAQQG